MVNHRGPEGHDGNWNPRASHCYRTLRFLVAASRAAGLDGVLQIDRAPGGRQRDHVYLTFEEVERLDEATATRLAGGSVSTWVYGRADEAGDYRPVGAAVLHFTLDGPGVEVQIARGDLPEGDWQDPNASDHPLQDARYERMTDEPSDLLDLHLEHLGGLGLYADVRSGGWKRARAVQGHVTFRYTPVLDAAVCSRGPCPTAPRAARSSTPSATW